MRKKHKTKKFDPISHMKEGIGLGVASSVGVTVMGSMPVPSAAPALGSAIGVVGGAFGVMQTLHAGKGVLKMTESLESVEKKHKKK